MQRVASQKGDLFESYTQTDTAKCFNDSTLAAMRTLAQAKGMTDAVANIDVIIKDRPSSPEAPPTFSSGAGI
jgi:hypothetical protein